MLPLLLPHLHHRPITRCIGHSISYVPSWVGYLPHGQVNHSRHGQDGPLGVHSFVQLCQSTFLMWCAVLYQTSSSNSHCMLGCGLWSGPSKPFLLDYALLLGLGNTPGLWDYALSSDHSKYWHWGCEPAYSHAIRPRSLQTRPFAIIAWVRRP